MPTKSPELSQEQRIAVETAIIRAKELRKPGQEELVPIDLIEDKAVRMLIISALQSALNSDEKLGGGIVASLFSNERDHFLKVAKPSQTQK